MAKISIDMYLLTIAVIVSYIVVKIDPIKMIKNLFPIYTFYYKKSDIRVTKNTPSGVEDTNNNSSNGESNFKKNISDVKLYSDPSLKNVAGFAFYSNFILKTDNGQYDIENAQYFINEFDSFNFIESTFSKNKEGGFLNPGMYTYTITGGSGKFANASGTIVFNVQNNGMRKVQVYL